jgi:hypothetical protein
MGVQQQPVKMTVLKSDLPSGLGYSILQFGYRNIKRDGFSGQGMTWAFIFRFPFFLGVFPMLATDSRAVVLSLLTAIRDDLTDAGLSPFAITWGPWWEESYYAV